MDEALSFARQAVASARGERSADRIADAFGIAAALRLVGDIQQQMREREAARKTWAAGLSLLRPDINARPREIFERSALLSRLGRSVEARPLVAKLRSGGFRRVN